MVSNAAVNPFFGSILDATEDVWEKVRGLKWRAEKVGVMNTDIGLWNKMNWRKHGVAY